MHADYHIDFTYSNRGFTHTTYSPHASREKSDQSQNKPSYFNFLVFHTGSILDQRKAPAREMLQTLLAAQGWQVASPQQHPGEVPQAALLCGLHVCP
jgi:hypothetical protein